MHKVAVIVGSLRRDSINRQFAQALAKLGGEQFQFDLLRLDDLPMYNDDLLEPEPPAPVRRLKATVDVADAVLFVTPEYNRSTTPIIKNVIDWGSRPLGASCWTDKPASIVGASDGSAGTAVAQAQLRAILVNLGMPVLAGVEVYFTHRPGVIDAEHQVVDDSTRQFLGLYLAKFAAWIARFSST